MKELIKLRDRLLGEYEYAIDMMDIQNEADGLKLALDMVTEQINAIIDKEGL